MDLQKSKIISTIEFVLGGISILYCIVLQILDFATLLGIIFSFSNAWLLLGAILIFLGTYRKNHGKSFLFALSLVQRKIVLTLIAIGVLISFVNLAFILKPAISENPKADIVILLGGGIKKDGELTKVVKMRCDVAAKYLLENPDSIVVVTGGTLKKLPPEAPAMKNYLVQKSISENRILVEDKALDTIQNLQFSCALLSENKNCSKQQILQSDVLLVTTFFHLARAQRLAHRMGFTKIVGLGSKTDPIKIPNCYAREICAYVKLNLRILLTRKPAKITD